MLDINALKARNDLKLTSVFSLQGAVLATCAAVIKIASKCASAQLRCQNECNHSIQFNILELPFCFWLIQYSCIGTAYLF